MPVDDGWVIDGKGMLASKMGAEFVVGNATAAGSFRLLGILGIVLLGRLFIATCRLFLILILVLSLRFGFILARRLHIVLGRLGCLGARFIWRRFGIFALVLCIRQSTGCEKQRYS